MKLPCLLFAVGAILGMASGAGAAEGARGADIAWTTYEAEASVTNGRVLGPDYGGQTPAREASGRRCVRLGRTGEFVEFTARSAADGMVVRYCIPDTADGRGMDATLGLYVNGKFRRKLKMTSRFAYLYGAYPFSNSPAAGSPRHFWDELRTMPGEIDRGDVVRLEKDGDDESAEYLIDFVDLERVGAAMERPAGSVSVMEFGARGDGEGDDRPAFVAALGAAKQRHETVWIPAGRYVIAGAIEVSDVTIRGAGMWYSTLVGARDYRAERRVAIRGTGSNVHLSDFAISGALNYRNDAEANDGIGGCFGRGSSIRNIWVEHTKTGAWMVNSDGLVVEGCRFRDTIADGINLCVGMHNTLVRDCTARGTGDDCFAIWPATYAESVYRPGGNRFVHCTAQLPFLAQGFSIYGGDGNSVEDCKAVDIPYGAGLYASSTFPTAFGFAGRTSYFDDEVIRCGDADGAVGIVTNLAALGGLRFSGIDVIDSARDGIKIISIKGRALSDTRFDRVRVVNAGISGEGSGVVAAANAVGSAVLRDVTVEHSKDKSIETRGLEFHFSELAGAEEKGSPAADLAAAPR